MDILDYRSVREDARRALARGRDPKKLIFAYALITLILSALLMLTNLWADQEISGAGGLSNLGTRAIFSTVQQAMPILAGLLAMCLELGYLGGMMRISRGQYADQTDLRIGLQKFWPLIRLNALQTLICLLPGILAAQLGGLVFAMTPWARPAMEAITALGSADPAALTEAQLLHTISLMSPMYAICGVLYLVILIPVLYKLRFARFCLLDEPNGSALAAIRCSFRLTRRRFFSLLKIDLRLWLYHAATAFTSALMFADLILAAFGITLPINAATLSLAVYAAGLLVQFLVHLTLRNQAEAVYLTAYDRLREKPKEGGPVTLGNIFDM